MKIEDEHYKQMYFNVRKQCDQFINKCRRLEQDKLKIQLEVLDRFATLLEANKNSKTGMSKKEIYRNLISDLRVEAGKDPLSDYDKVHDIKNERFRKEEGIRRIDLE